MVQESPVSRRDLLRRGPAVAGGAIALAGVLGATGAEAKIAQDTVAYQQSPHNGEVCSDCTHFVAPSSCQLVDGTINAQGWCKLFAKKSS